MDGYLKIEAQTRCGAHCTHGRVALNLMTLVVN